MKRRTSRTMRPAIVVSCFAVALAACASAAPRPRPGPQTSGAPTAAGRDDGPEIATDGKSTVTVLSRPDHPLARKPGKPAPEPMSDAKCRAKQACAESGLCSASGTECIAKSFVDCQQMRACGHGRCSFEDGGCKAVQSCKQSHGCRQNGLCADKGEGCIAGDVDGCRGSVACTRNGRCNLRNEVCVASINPDCKDAEVCTAGGRCIADGGSCRALSDAQCRRSAACKDHRRCLARDGVCVKSCPDSEPCSTFGRCGQSRTKPNSCIALTDADCERATVCADLGHCSMSLTGTCQTGDDVECRRSRTCREDGRCTFHRDRCLPASDVECANAAVACKREGRCRHDGGRCVK